MGLKREILMIMDNGFREKGHEWWWRIGLERGILMGTDGNGGWREECEMKCLEMGTEILMGECDWREGDIDGNG